MAEKTKSGRTKRYICPYCKKPCYSVYSLNMHIAGRHPGKETIDPNKRDKAQKLKPFKKEKPEAKPEEETAAEPEPEDPEPEDPEENDDPYD